MHPLTTPNHSPKPSQPPSPNPNPNEPACVILTLLDILDFPWFSKGEFFYNITPTSLISLVRLKLIDLFILISANQDTLVQCLANSVIFCAFYVVNLCMQILCSFSNI